MSRVGDNESDGSDIEVDTVLDGEGIGTRDLPDHLELAQEMVDDHMGFMVSDSSSDDEFVGFPRQQDDWVTDGFGEQLDEQAYSWHPGPAADSTPVQYFLDAGFWEYIFTETNS